MRWTLITLLIVVAAEALAAQGGRNSVHGSLGWGKTWDDEGSLGGGLNWSAGAGRRITPRTAVEAEVFRASNKRDQGVFQADGNATIVGGNIIRHFSGGRTQPFVLVGAGFFHYRGFASLSPQPPEGARSGWALRAGAGMKTFVSPTTYLRPEFTWFSGGRGRNTTVISFPVMRLGFGLGLGYEW